MFCITLVLLLQCLFGSSGYTFTVGGPDLVQLDLFDSLNLHNSTYQGITLGVGVNPLSPGIIFTGDIRETMVTSDWIERVRSKLSKFGENEFTISATIKQNPNNVGTLLAFSRGLFSALEIQSSGRKNELRVISGSSVETFPFRLADGVWHRLAISFSALQVDILVDCNPVYRRVLKFNPTSAIFNTRNISLWIGQKTTSHFLYQGVMQDLKLTFGPFGYLSQCPQMDTQCPTCSEFTALKLNFASLQSQFQLLTERLNLAEARLNNVEQCECQKSCRVNESTTYTDGSTWEKNCSTCSCKKGKVECHKLECPPVNCTNPIQRPGECCPTCLRKCYFKQRTYDHGEVESIRECVECKCTDGSMSCKPLDPVKDCPTLTCPPSQQISIPGECCKICPGTDYCASHGDKCHSNATCVNLQTTFTCQCKEGFSGDGVKACEDLDECLLDRNHCSRNTKCINNLGGYSCECLEGYQRLNQFQCEDEDECRFGGSNQCHPSAVCQNTKGSYTCTCKEGFIGDGFFCKPICNQTCENGGVCVAPDICSCRSGWTGNYCETDLDECTESINLLLSNQGSNSTTLRKSLCPNHAVCVNKPGWYLCECEEGFQASIEPSTLEAKCQDINECENDRCSEGFQCTNLPGSYKCECMDTNSECSMGCSDGGKWYSTGSKWFSQEDCNVCSCSAPGTKTCDPSTIENCSELCAFDGLSRNSVESYGCCDKCTSSLSPRADNLTLIQPEEKSCLHQLYPHITYKSGEVWHSQCQTCECQNGEVDCWQLECPPINCENPILPKGDCCYRCPEEKCTHRHNYRNSSSFTTFTECNLHDTTSSTTTISSGTQVTLPHNPCISCKCRGREYAVLGIMIVKLVLIQWMMIFS